MRIIVHKFINHFSEMKSLEMIWLISSALLTQVYYWLKLFLSYSSEQKDFIIIST
jgi:hypothetical protein